MSTSMKKLVLIGDSIRMGYENEVKKLLADKVEIFAPVENGGNSRKVKSKLDEWVIDQSPDILHINCGLHDIKREFGSGEVAVSLSEYKTNLQYILTAVSSKVETVIWATTTPVNSEWHRKNKGFDRFSTDVSDYNQVSVSLSDDLGIHVNDLHQLIMNIGVNECLLLDGVHFNQSGSVHLGQAVAKAIQPHLNLKG